MKKISVLILLVITSTVLCAQNEGYKQVYLNNSQIYSSNSDNEIVELEISDYSMEDTLKVILYSDNYFRNHPVFILEYDEKYITIIVKSSVVSLGLLKNLMISKKIPFGKLYYSICHEENEFSYCDYKTKELIIDLKVND